MSKPTCFRPALRDPHREEKKKEKKSPLLSMIKEKLMVNLSFPWA